jgi:hypothetical protein
LPPLPVENPPDRNKKRVKMEQTALNDLGISNELELNQLLTADSAYSWIDRIVIRAHKHLVDPQRGIDRRFPLTDNWKQSQYLKKIPTPFYYNYRTGECINAETHLGLHFREIPDWSQISEYQLNHAALKWFEKDTDKSILNDIRLELKGNDFEISLTGILTSRAPESRLKLLVETIQALVRIGIIKANWSEASEKTAPYAIIRKHFHVAVYEIRIDSGRYGKPFYDKCRKQSPWTIPLEKINQRSGEIFNQVQFHSTDNRARRKRGFDLVCYDRSKKHCNRGADPNLFPYRLEVKLLKRLLEGKCRKDSPCILINDLLKNRGIVVEALKTNLVEIIETGVKKMKTGIEFDLFVNKKRSGKSIKQSINDLITHGSMTDKINYCLEKSRQHDKEIAEMKRTINKLLIHHGTTLPHQRGLKVV